MSSSSCSIASDHFMREVAAEIGLSDQQATPVEVLAHVTRLKKLNELVLALSQISHINEAYRVVAQYTREIIGAARVSVAILQEGGTSLELYGVDGIQGVLPNGISLPVANTLLGEVITSQEPLRVDGIQGVPSRWLDVQKLRSVGIQAAVSVPLVAHGRIIGTLNTAVKDGTVYFPEVEHFLLQIATVLASIIERDRLYNDACQARQQAIESEKRAVVANNAKTMFLSQMTHELRTPMNGVLGMTTLLGQTALSPTQAEMVCTIQTSGDALLATINDILDYTKIEANKLKLETVPFAPAACIRDALALLRAQAQEKGVAFQTEVSPDCPPVVVQDVCRTRQVLANLVGNAIKFSNEGTPIKVTAGLYRGDPAQMPSSQDSKEVKDSLEAKEKKTSEILYTTDAGASPGTTPATVHFSVQDSGIGIPPERQHSLFDSFTQVDASTTRKYGGSGLGLCISKRLTGLMGGRIWVNSTPGVGSTFHFTIRAQIGDSLWAKATRPSGFDATLGDRLPLRILLVDDVKVNRKVALSFLERLGFRDVAVAEDGRQAVSAAEATPFDVVLMDIHMPVMDGYEAARRIRQGGASRRSRIIALSADAMTHRRVHALQSGMDDFVSKPVRIKELTRALEGCKPVERTVECAS